MRCSFTNEVTSSHANTRRWRRFRVDLPVRVLTCSRLPAVVMTGRGTELSRNGMALHAAVDIELDDLLEVEFLIPHPLKVLATVRSRRGYYFGLQFLAMRAG
jgi:hypothetical protein